ncbi:MAG: glycosyltransferase, partial [Anaerolineae bacterium]
MITLSIIIPAYNEENGIAKTIERVLAVRPAVAKAGVDGFEVIVVDDGS